ncbi:alpha-L-fucosidase 2 [Pseudoduganella lurida]|uniref:Alpha-L-fucosidase 2 n=1 Tax=Pseudoduganella lurida TaxID=1036180 RepID=A0A562RF98_9BURK|nr:glycoside hydrolase family 95 protein [Pseudoduganella lurida]TWI67739.1 alpha-L-fucosidase 2 [Pseudoduganella lurida]
MAEMADKAGKERTGGGIARREFIVAAGLALAFPGLAGARAAVTSTADREDLALWYDQPAGPWVEALPVGNGRIGAMVFGRVAQERLQLNEDTLFAGGPHNPNNPAMRAALPRVRALIDAGRYQEASDLAERDLLGKPGRQMPYGTAGDLLIDFDDATAPATYRRSLDLDSAIATTQLGSASVREVFASTADQVVVAHFSSPGKTFGFQVRYRHPDKATYDSTRLTEPVTQAGKGGAAWDHREDARVSQRPASLSVRGDGAGCLLVEGHNIASFGIDGALRYAVRIKAVGDGEIVVDGDRIEVRNATQVTLLVALATSYVDFRDVSGDPVAIVRRQVDAAARKPYGMLKNDHLAAHRAQFRNFALRLDIPAQDRRTTKARILDVERAPDPAMAALYVQYARYLLLSCSRPGSQPANLQGLWNEGVNPPWGSKYTININTEMNYWPAGPANLGVCVEPLVRMVEDLAVNGAVTARDGYGARGWVAHHNTDLWRSTAPIDGAKYGIWPMGGAWLCMSLWDHYEYHPDAAYLRRIYPLLKGASQFFLDTLVEDPQGRGLVTSPSLSPENAHRPGVALCAGPAMDSQILRDLFAVTAQAHALLLEKDKEFVAALEKTRARLPADRIGAQGQLQEWLDDWDAAAPEQQHRHVSHLYAIYPSSQLNVRDTPALIAAAKHTLNTRGDKSTGWATAWRLCLWARMGEGDRAHAILLGLMGPERSYPNLFDAHPPFQIDGNFGGAAGILEMLVQSWGGEIRLLPALPSSWRGGALRGVRARGGVEIDIEWKAGRFTRAVLRGPAGKVVQIRDGAQLVALTLDGNGQAIYR